MEKLIILAIFWAIASWIKKIVETAKSSDGPASAAPQQSPLAEKADWDERQRQIREEIRRKIRARVAGEEPPVASPVLPTEAAEGESETPMPRRNIFQLPELQPVDPFGGGDQRGAWTRGAEALAPEPARAAVEVPLVSERNEAEAERELTEADTRLAAAFVPSNDAWDETEENLGKTAGPTGASGTDTLRTVRTQLRDPASLRRAFLLNEILRPPVALR